MFEVNMMNPRKFLLAFERSHEAQAHARDQRRDGRDKKTKDLIELCINHRL
jgi:hypothetical protein